MIRPSGISPAHRDVNKGTDNFFPHQSSTPMSTSLDLLKASGTVVVSDSGDFESEPD